jgi:hypothetical protein
MTDSTSVSRQPAISLSIISAAWQVARATSQ